MDQHAVTADLALEQRDEAFHDRARGGRERLPAAGGPLPARGGARHGPLHPGDGERRHPRVHPGHDAQPAGSAFLALDRQRELTHRRVGELVRGDERRPTRHARGARGELADRDRGQVQIGEESIAGADRLDRQLAARRDQLAHHLERTPLAILGARRERIRCGSRVRGRPPSPSAARAGEELRDPLRIERLGDRGRRTARRGAARRPARTPPRRRDSRPRQRRAARRRSTAPGRRGTHRRASASISPGPELDQQIGVRERPPERLGEAHRLGELRHEVGAQVRVRPSAAPVTRRDHAAARRGELDSRRGAPPALARTAPSPASGTRGRPAAAPRRSAAPARSSTSALDRRRSRPPRRSAAVRSRAARHSRAPRQSRSASAALAARLAIAPPATARSETIAPARCGERAGGFVGERAGPGERRRSPRGCVRPRRSRRSRTPRAPAARRASRDDRGLSRRACRRLRCRSAAEAGRASRCRSTMAASRARAAPRRPRPARRGPARPGPGTATRSRPARPAPRKQPCSASIRVAAAIGQPRGDPPRRRDQLRRASPRRSQPARPPARAGAAARRQRRRASPSSARDSARRCARALRVCARSAPRSGAASRNSSAVLRRADQRGVPPRQLARARAPSAGRRAPRAC